MRERVLAAALTLYMEQGLDGVSIRTIAERIEFSPGTIYLYYRDKSDLLFALYNHAFGLYYTEQLQGSQIPDPVDRLRADCRHYVLWGLAHPKLYELMYILDVPMDVIAREQCVDIGRRSFEVLREVVGRAVAAGRLRIKDTELATTLLWNLLHGIVSLILKRRVLVRPEELHRTVDAMIDTELLLLVR